MNATSITSTSVATHNVHGLLIPNREPSPGIVTLEPSQATPPLRSSPHLRSTGYRRILVATQLAHHDLLKGITRFAKENRWQLITDMLHTGTLPRRWDGDGILAFVTNQSEISSYVAGTEIPCVTASLTDDCKALPRIQPDNIAIGQLAAKHLINRNCRNFIWAPFFDNSQNRERFLGFVGEISKHGYSYEILPAAHRKTGAVWTSDWPEWNEKVSTKLLKLKGRTGLFASNDCLSVELACLAEELGIKVPDELAIIGFGNETIECESAPITLSSIDPNMEDIAYNAAKLLADILEGRESSDTIIKIKPAGIVARESTAISSQESTRVEQALSFIAKHYPEPSLGVSTVAESLDISRRQLERDFRNEKKCTVRDYIELTRMNEASRLLVEQPDINITSIAELVGISAPGNFFRIFRKRFGTTPAEFRKQN